MESIRQIAFSAELLCLHYMPYASPLLSLHLPNELIQTHTIPHTRRNILCSVTTFAGPIIVTLSGAPFGAASQKVVTEEARSMRGLRLGKCTLYHIDQATCYFLRALYV